VYMMLDFINPGRTGVNIDFKTLWNRTELLHLNHLDIIMIMWGLYCDTNNKKVNGQAKWGDSRFHQFFQEKFWQYLQLDHSSFLHISHLIFINHIIIRRCTVWASDRAVG
jgi:hypothetical protein